MRRLFGLALLGGLAACTTADKGLTTNGVTPGAGNAQTANTVMQMVDPWPEGIDDTELKVPADRGKDAESELPDKPVTNESTSDN